MRREAYELKSLKACEHWKCKLVSLSASQLSTLCFLQYTSPPLHRLLSLLFGIHGKTAVFMLVLAASTASFVAMQKANVSEQPSIVLKHAYPLSASIRTTRKNTQALMAFDHTGQESVALSVPTHWQLVEARGLSGATLPHQESGLGFEQWILPQNSGVTFHMQDIPAHLLLKNISPYALQLHIITVRLEDDSVEERTVLVQGVTNLW